MNLRQLQYFVEVSELESVTKAADRLHVAQPALSRHMRTLERDLGVRLFEREGRGIILTNAGIVFRDRVRTLLRELDRAQIEVKALSRSPGGRIDFGMPFSISQALTRALVKRMQQELPDVALRIIDGWTGFIIEWLMRGRLDLGILYDHTLKSDVLRTEPLAAEEQFLLCAPHDKLAKRRSIRLAEVARLPLALPSREHGLRVAVDKFMESIGKTPRIRTELEFDRRLEAARPRGRNIYDPAARRDGGGAFGGAPQGAPHRGSENLPNSISCVVERAPEHASDEGGANVGAPRDGQHHQKRAVGEQAASLTTAACLPACPRDHFQDLFAMQSEILRT